MQEYVAGIDLGGTKIYAALSDEKGSIIVEEKVPTRSENGIEYVLNNICSTVESLQQRAGSGSRLKAVGIGAPGPLNPETGMIYQAPNLECYDVPLADYLQERLKAPVLVENDANIAALGEFTFGAAAGVHDLVYITVSTGVGGGLILGGKIYHGISGAAGEIGHINVDPSGPLCSCGSSGCLEAAASGTAIARRACRLVQEGRGREILNMAGGDVENITAEHVVCAAAGGDAEALVIIKDAAGMLGRAAASLVNLLNPAMVVLGGGVINAGNIFWNPMKEEFHRHCLKKPLEAVKVVPAGLGDKAGLMGALALAVSAGSLQDH
ncbi:MAG: ROK family protein [Clostridiales bacterium]|nr:ROK family protein [Clostridiales bacterium]MCF8023582.1 ROK family protein [Clostridiales bacterium]